MPSSPSLAPLGGMSEICSTSPCRMRKRWLSRSTPRVRSSAATSLNVRVRPSTWYREELSLKTVRLTYHGRGAGREEPSG